MFFRIPQRLALMLCLCGFVFAASTPAGVWLDVPFVPQEKDGCGSASIAMVMQYWQKQQGRAGEQSADASAIQRELYSSKAHGIYASDLEKYFKEHGYRTFAFAGRWDDFQQHLEKGRPLIVALKPLPGSHALHYVVVVGIDGAQNLVFLNDPAQRKLLKEDRAAFEQEWSAAGKWTLLALPLSQTP